MLATLLSIILVVGLSPIGKAPGKAYAANGQSASEWTSITMTVGGKTDPTITYNGFAQELSSLKVRSDDGLAQPAAASTPNPAYSYKVTVFRPGIDPDTGTGQVYTAASTGVSSWEAAEATDFKSGQLPTDITSDNSVSVDFASDTKFYFLESGDYTFRVEGADGWQGISKDFTVNVAKLDLSKVTFSQVNLKYTAADQALDVQVNNSGTNYNCALVEGADYKVGASTVKDIRTYNPVITALGDNTTGENDELTFDVTRNFFLSKTTTGSDDYATVNGTAVDVAVSSYAKTGTVTANVGFDKLANPVTVAFNGEELVEGEDYDVKYYVATDVTHATPVTLASLKLGQTGGATSFEAKIDITDTNRFYASGEAVGTDTWTGTTSVVARLNVTKASTIEEVAASAVLANGKYAGGADVEVKPADGGAFADAEGNDVTAAIGTYFQVKPPANTAYGVLATGSSAATAELGGTSNLPVGAGDYYVTVTGDGTQYEAGDGIVAHFTVDPAVAKEGTDVGDLLVTIADQPYKDGDYVDPEPTVKMFTTKNDADSATNIEKSGTGALGSKYTNWKVTYTNEAGDVVDLPSAKGTYTATFEFSGNLDGTPKIEKTFKVETGAIAGKLSRIATAELVYTGAGREAAAKDLTFIGTDGTTEYTAESDLLANCDIALSYSSRGNATVDSETGLPVNAGTYNMTATFSGEYEGTVTGLLKVSQLNLTSGSTNAEVQYLQSDKKSYDTTHSVAATGSAIEPELRVVVKDGKQKSATPTVVEDAVYKSSFKKNTDAGIAETYLAAASSTYASNLVTSSSYASRFTITNQSFDDISAYLDLPTKSATYTGSEIPFTLQLKSSAGALPYSDGAVTEYTPGTATVVVSGVTAYAEANNETALAKFGLGYDATKVSTAALTDRLTATNGAAYKDSTLVETVKYTPTGGSEQTLYKYSLDIEYAGKPLFEKGGSYYLKNNGADGAVLTYKSYDAALTTGSIASDGVTFTALEKGTGAATVTATNVSLNKTGSNKYYIDTDLTKEITASCVTAEGAAGTALTAYTPYTNATVAYTGQTIYMVPSANTYYYVDGDGALSPVATQYTDPTTGTVVTGSFNPTGYTAASVASGKGYALKVLGSDGKQVATASFSATEAPYTTVTVYGLSKADTYTVVATAGSDAVYGGRVTADFAINGLDIEDTSAFAVTYTKTTAAGGTSSTVTHPISANWSTTYDATKAKSADGITLGVSDGESDGLAVKTSTGELLVKDRDYTLDYANNKGAGTATVTVKGKGNYSGTVTKDFAIEAASIYKYGSTGHTNDGYEIVWDDTKLSKNGLTYTGSALEPAFKVNYYVNESGTKTLKSTFTEYETAWFNNVNVAYGTTGVDALATAQITASGNYTGTLENSFKINPVALTAENVTISDIPAQPATGSTIIPDVTVKYGDYTLKQGAEYQVTSDNDGTPGEATALIKQVDGGNFTIAAPIEKAFTITKAAQVVEVGTANFSKTYGDGQFKIGATLVTGDGAVTFTPDNSGVVSVSADGTVTILKAGTAHVTVGAAATDDYSAAADVDVTIDVAKASQTVATSGALAVAVGKTAKITAVGEGALTFTPADPLVATVAADGTVTGVAAGTTTITVYAAGNDNYNPGTAFVVATVGAASSDGQGSVNQGGGATAAKAANTISATAKKVTVKAKTLKKKKVTKAADKYFKVSGVNGAKATYKLNSAKKGGKSFKSKFSVNSSTGKLTIKKNTKKGTYKLTITASSAATDTVAAGSAKKVVTVRVK